VVRFENSPSQGAYKLAFATFIRASIDPHTALAIPEGINLLNSAALTGKQGANCSRKMDGREEF
jgi:hypothetical protein